jgi:hypothetical protein
MIAFSYRTPCIIVRTFFFVFWLSIKPLRNTKHKLRILPQKFPITKFNACMLKAHSHSKSGSSIWASLECHCCFWIAGGLVSYLTMRLPTLQLFKNSSETEGKLRLNLHSLSVSELLGYRRKYLCFMVGWKFFPTYWYCCTMFSFTLTLPEVAVLKPNLLRTLC